MKLTKIGEFLKRSKIPIDIEDKVEYNRVTIRINHNGVSLRDSELGKLIGTKKQFILKAGQFIVSKIDARYGAFGIAPIEVDNAIITGNFWAYDVDKDLINIDWFNQFTNSPVFYEVCERASSGITHRKYLDEKFFLNYQILLPSVDEQLIQIVKIASQKVLFGVLSSELSHQLSLVKKLRKQLLQDAVQGKLVEQNKKDEPASELLKKIKAEKKFKKELPPIKPAELSFEIPDNWVWCRLGEIIKISSGDGLTASQMDKDGTIPVYGGNGVNGYHNKFNLQKETIVIGRVGYYCGCVHLTRKYAWVTDNAFTVFYSEKNIDRDFLIQLLKWADLGKHQFAGSQPVISGQRVYPKLIPLPPLAEQHRIVQKLDELMQYCNDLEASIKQSESQNEKLLQQVLREALRKEPVEV